MLISIVIPVFNEEKNVAKLYDEMVSVLNGRKYEIIFVDDGSMDNTFDELKKLDVKVVKLRKNFGQSAALLAGFEHASGDIIVTLDGDGQNDPKDIHKLIEKIGEYDCVSGWRYKRQDKFFVRMFSRISNFLRHLLINDQINDSGCCLKAYKKECLKGLELYGEMHRYIASLVRIKGFKIGEVKVNHRARLNGNSKYGLSKVVKGFLDLWTVWFWQKFSLRPMHLFGLSGILIFFIGGILGMYSVYLKLFNGIDLSDTFLPTVALIFVVIGLQLFLTGLLSDIMIKNYNKGRKTYEIEYTNVKL